MSLAVYLHWPYCVSKCPYCDFNSHVREGVKLEPWHESLPAAITAQRQWLESRGYEFKPVTSIFFGGGTPSLMPSKLVETLIDRVAREFTLASDAEITLEANPNSVEAEKFKAFAAAGVNRVSIGVQSFEADGLKFLGRAHSQGEAMKAIELAQAIFPRVSFDLIYGLPDQSVADWQAQMARALQMGTDHLSLYQLTIEQGTAFASAYGRGDFVMPSPELAADLYEATEAATAAAGIKAYEVSNYARVGQESRHNLAYWNYDDYLGIGPGAHGRVSLPQKHATRQEKLPETWLKSNLALNGGNCEVTAISRSDQFAETLMMGLRLVKGIDRARFTRDMGMDIDQIIPTDRLNNLVEENYLLVTPEQFALTLSGRLRLNLILDYLLEGSRI
ncbi:MAG: radical SAM family heme chaperone HemW [Candidatus Pacebacteria bacterium]|nr:radical SAM family heme chaperone HemW [Candidatus Paceibacterota bacterium]